MVKPIVAGSIGCPDDFNNYSKQLSISFDTGSHHFAEENIYVQIEPEELVNHDWLVRDYANFNHIFGWEEKLVGLPNFHMFPFGTSWIDINRDYKKEFGVSHIMSSKGQLPGHQLRYAVFNKINSLNVKKLNVRTPPRIERKDSLFDGYEYSVIIENLSKNNWFTEKLIDCLVSRTIPIYFGCPNIGTYFDDSYFLKFTDIFEFNSIVDNLDSGYYSKFLDRIEYNRSKALEYANIFKRLNKELDSYYA